MSNSHRDWANPNMQLWLAPSCVEVLDWRGGGPNNCVLGTRSMVTLVLAVAHKRASETASAPHASLEFI